MKPVCKGCQGIQSFGRSGHDVDHGDDHDDGDNEGDNDNDDHEHESNFTDDNNNVVKTNFVV